MAGKLGWRRSRMLVVAGALAVCLAAGDGGAFAAAAAGRPARPVGSLRAGQTGPRSAVPWRRVGAGWVLAVYWPGSLGLAGKAKAAAAVLYLFDPAGGRYRLYRWPVTKNPPFLEGWSGDKTRALISTTAGAVEQVVLATGKVSRVRLPGQVQVIGYTRPRGLGLLGSRRAGSGFQLARYRLNGRLAKVLVADADSITAVYSGTGTTLAVGARQGIWLASNHGGVIRALPVPGISGRCFPSRWWNSAVILASCQAAGTSRSRLWLVSASGSTPTPLTAQRGRHSPDPGDIGAWQLRGRLYLQALTSAGSGRIFRQAADGPVAQIAVPRTAGNNWILAALGSRLLLSARTPCYDSASLLWFNPATRHEQMLISAPHGLAGVLGAVPYGQPTANLDILVGCA